VGQAAETSAFVIVIAKPTGRGNYAVITIEIKGRHMTPLMVRPGDRFMLGLVQLKVVEVRP